MKDLQDDFYTIQHTDGRITKFRMRTDIKPGQVNLYSINFPPTGIVVSLDELISAKLSATIEISKEDIERLNLILENKKA